MGFKISSSANIIVESILNRIEIDSSANTTHRILVESEYAIVEKESKKVLFKKSVVGEFFYGPEERIDMVSSVYSATSKAIEEFVRSAQAAGFLGV